MLHEAGHIAVTDPLMRPALCNVSSDPAEEMVTIAWSYAAALAAGIDPSVAFHDEGYLAETLARGETMGQPMLHFWGMCTDGNIDRLANGPIFPRMLRWL